MPSCFRRLLESKGNTGRRAPGFRTYTIVGTAAALFLLISKYGFTNVLASGTVVLDPSRVWICHQFK
jgi:uncharacterized membrane protein YhiD involved in acid resistance